MRVYYTGGSPANLREARRHAPSHSHGFGWTPEKMTPHDVPYFLDNGAYAGAFDAAAWQAALTKTRIEMPTRPDFIVMPDVYGDAVATRRLHDRWTSPRRDDALIAFRADWTRYGVLQPGVPLADQFAALRPPRYAGVFVGGPRRWKRAHGDQIVRRAHAAGLRAHVGNPGGRDGLVWAARVGFDSCDTTTIFQNGYWHYLDALERATTAATTATVTASHRTATEQVTLTDAAK